MYLYGAGGHAKVIMDILKSLKKELQGIFDDHTEVTDLLGIPVLSSEKVRGPLMISIGNNLVRKRLAEKLDHYNFETLVSPFAWMSDLSTIATGSVVMPGVMVQPCVRIGKHCILNTSSVVEHDCEIADYVHISPHATLCGNVQVGEGSWIGAGAVVLPGVKIGPWSVVGAGSVVTKDIPGHVVAVGNYCRVIKKI